MHSPLSFNEYFKFEYGSKEQFLALIYLKQTQNMKMVVNIIFSVIYLKLLLSILWYNN